MMAMVTRATLVTVAATGLVFLSGVQDVVASGPTMTVDIDATDLPRKLLSATVRIGLSDDVAKNGGEVALWYPKWVPGTHGPGGPVQNIAGLLISDDDGHVIDWTRTPGEAHRITAHVPAGTDEIILNIRYITNQSTANSTGVDSFGDELIGFVSVNTVMLYREDLADTDITVTSSILMPEDWSCATALHVAKTDEDENRIHFEPETLERFVDSPILLARYMKTYDLIEKDMKEKSPPQRLHILTEAKGVLDIDKEVLKQLRQMVTQATKLFGSHPFEEFDFLVATSNQMSHNGLEHLECTFNVISQRSLKEKKNFKGWEKYLIPHEYVHSWCGKYRRPAGMVTHDFHTAKDTELLWVYEGLTQYLGKVIEGRAGMMTREEYEWSLLGNIRSARLQQGREWRSLADTGAASHTLRGGSRNWSRLRRGQDYYMEGALCWLEADAKIRNMTDGKKSLDDFCQAFFKHQEDEPNPLGFDRDEIVRTMNEVAPYDWDTFFAERIDRPTKEFSLGLATELGYHVQYSNTPPTGPNNASIDGLDARESIGASFSGDGRVREVALGSPADDAGLGPGMKVVGIGDFVWSKDRLIEAIAATAATGQIDLMLVSGDKYITKTIEYNEGPRYMVFIRDEKKPDRLGEILKAK